MSKTLPGQLGLFEGSTTTDSDEGVIDVSGAQPASPGHSEEEQEAINRVGAQADSFDLVARLAARNGEGSTTRAAEKAMTTEEALERAKATAQPVEELGSSSEGSQGAREPGFSDDAPLPSPVPSDGAEGAASETLPLESIDAGSLQTLHRLKALIDQGEAARAAANVLLETLSTIHGLQPGRDGIQLETGRILRGTLG